MKQNYKHALITAMLAASTLPLLAYEYGCKDACEDKYFTDMEDCKKQYESLTEGLTNPSLAAMSIRRECEDRAAESQTNCKKNGCPC